MPLTIVPLAWHLTQLNSSKKIIIDKVVTFLETITLITDNQHGFRIKRSSLNNVLIFFNDVYSNWDDGASYDLSYLDFLKAIDKVLHVKPIFKLHSSRLGDNHCKWIKDWLTDRQ